MTILGEKLNEIIKANDIVIYQLAKKAGIDRPAIHKIINAKYHPSDEFMKKLLEAIPVTPSEKEEIRQAFEIYKVGEQVYNQRSQVQEIIGRIPAILDIPLPDKSISFELRNKHTQDIEFVTDDLLIANLIEDIINIEINNSKELTIYFSLPYDYKFFYDFIFRCYSKVCNLKIKCLIEFCKKGNRAIKKNQNLDALQAILPLLLSPRQGFNAYYMYSDMPVNKSIICPMPYYLITSEYVLTLSADLKKGLLYHNNDVLECYKKLFDDTLEQAQPLVKHFSSLNESITVFQNIFNNREADDSPLCCLEAQPCIAHYCDRNFFEKYTNPALPNREVFIETTSKYCQSIHCGNTNAFLTFSMEGLNRFLQTKKLAEIPNEFLKPIDKQDMILMIQSMIKDLTDENLNYRLVNSNKMKISNHANIDLFSKYCIVISYGMVGKCAIINNFITITEESISEAFYDFVINLQNTDLVYSKEDTLKVLYEALEFIKNQND